MQYNKRYFFKDIITLVFLSHLLLLAVVFLCDSGKFAPERFVINPQKVQSTIVFMPLKKRVIQQPVLATGKQKQLGKRKIIDYDKYQSAVAKKAMADKKASSLAKAKADKKAKSKKIVPPKIELAVKKPEISKNIPKTAIKKEPTKKLEPVKTVPKPSIKHVKKVEDKKLAAHVKEVVKPVVTKVEPIKVDENIIPEVVVPQPMVQEVIVEQNIQEPVQKDHDVQLLEDDQTDDLDDVTFVGSHDLEMLEIQENIRMQVVHHYKPPVGISKKAICELAVLVGADGKPSRVTVKKSSGSMANDMCARAALLKITFPKKVFGKEIIVELGQ